MSAVTTLPVRLTHVVEMAFVLGGVVFTWVTFRVGGPGYVDTGGSTTFGGDQTPSAALYELVFQAAMGAMVVTGIDNLGAFGPPEPSGRQGSLLTAELFTVTAFVLGSFVWTLVVFRLQRSGPTGLGHPLFAKGYGATAAAFLVFVTLAEVLAHG